MALSLRKTFRQIITIKSGEQTFETLFKFVTDNLEYIGMCKREYNSKI